MEIKGLNIHNKAVLAPMAGFCDIVMRKAADEFDAGFTISEMVSARALYFGDKKSHELMETFDHKSPYGVQLFGFEPNDFVSATKHVLDHKPDFIDINMGCPAPKIVNNGSGSALMKTPEIAEEIIRHVCHATLLPVTVKMRLGWDEESINAVEFAKMAEQAGACAVTVHGRTRKQQYSGHADWEKIAKVKQVVSIRVIANGDVVDAQSAREILRVTDADGIAVGRGALGNPWLFEEIKAMMRGEAYTRPSYDEVVETAMCHARGMEQWKGSL
jgi:nifR3 family TIM-barrel protein